MSFQISSTAFSNGETIPKKFTCDGPDVSPQLRWKEAPHTKLAARSGRAQVPVRLNPPALGTRIRYAISARRPAMRFDNSSFGSLQIDDSTYEAALIADLHCGLSRSN
jgi:hypothetical protein